MCSIVARNVNIFAQIDQDPMESRGLPPYVRLQHPISEERQPMSINHEALIQAMVLVSVSDGDMADSELESIGRIVRYAPVFDGFNVDELSNIAEACIAALSQDEGVDLIMASLLTKLDVDLRETAYAFALDVAAADAVITDEEMSVLEMLRHRLDIDRLIAAGIERGARARFHRA